MKWSHKSFVFVHINLISAADLVAEAPSCKRFMAAGWTGVQMFSWLFLKLKLKHNIVCALGSPGPCKHKHDMGGRDCVLSGLIKIEVQTWECVFDSLLQGHIAPREAWHLTRVVTQQSHKQTHIFTSIFMRTSIKQRSRCQGGAAALLRKLWDVSFIYFFVWG